MNMHRVRLFRLSCMLLLPLLWTSCRSPQTTSASRSGTMPRALFLTTGLSYGNGTIAPGVALALETFNRNNIPTDFDNRDILHDSSALARYSIIVALTSSGYHDGDRVHSLVYLSRREMQRLVDWVDTGGLLIGGDNLGRYFLDGTDRTKFTNGRLSAENWPLGRCFGVTLQERELHRFALHPRAPFTAARVWLEPASTSRWGMVVAQRYPRTTTVLATWESDSTSLPAIIHSRYGQGQAILATAPGFLHPSNAQGLMDIADIRTFYEYVCEAGRDTSIAPRGVSPWPHARPYAACVALHAEGRIEEFERVVDLLESHGVAPEFYVNAHLDPQVREAIVERGFGVYSAGFDPAIIDAFDFFAARQGILRNEQLWGRHFTGFRFPHGISSFSGLYTLNERGYLFDNSIKVDNVNMLQGTGVPYTIALSGPRGLYCQSSVVEIPPVAQDDYAFFSALSDDKVPSTAQMEAAARRYSHYLTNFVERVAVPCQGVVSYFGHVGTTGCTGTTLKPLAELLRKVQRDSAWIAPIGVIARYTRALRRLRVRWTQQDNTVTVHTHSTDTTPLNGVAFALARRPRSVSAMKGRVDLVERDSTWYAIADSLPEQRLTLEY